MNIQEEIAKKQTQIEILEVIKLAHRLIDLNDDALNGVAGTFPGLRKKYLHQNEIKRMAIKRLTERYNKLNN